MGKGGPRSRIGHRALREYNASLCMGFWVPIGYPKKCLLAFSALLRLPREENFFMIRLQTKYYLWANFEDIWSMSKSDIYMAISAIKKTKKTFFL